MGESNIFLDVFIDEGYMRMLILPYIRLDALHRITTQNYVFYCERGTKNIIWTIYGHTWTVIFQPVFPLRSGNLSKCNIIIGFSFQPAWIKSLTIYPSPIVQILPWMSRQKKHMQNSYHILILSLSLVIYTDAHLLHVYTYTFVYMYIFS